MASEDACNPYNLNPIGRLVDYAYSGCEPGVWDGPGLRHDKEEHGVHELSEIDLIKLNEAFAAQALAVMDACKSKNLSRKLGLEKYSGK